MSEVPAIISAEDPVTVLSLRRAAKKKEGRNADGSCLCFYAGCEPGDGSWGLM